MGLRCSQNMNIDVIKCVLPVSVGLLYERSYGIDYSLSCLLFHFNAGDTQKRC